MALQNGNGKLTATLLAVCTLLAGFILGDGLASYSVENRLNQRIDREISSVQRQLDVIAATQRDILKAVRD